MNDKLLEEEDFGLHPQELENEIEVSRKKEKDVPKREKDIKVQVKELPELKEQEEKSKPSMITISKSEAIERRKQATRRCPFDAKLECKDCRMSQAFLGTEADESCSIVRIAHRMPL